MSASAPANVEKAMSHEKKKGGLNKRREVPANQQPESRRKKEVSAPFPSPSTSTQHLLLARLLFWAQFYTARKLALVLFALNNLFCENK